MNACRHTLDTVLDDLRYAIRHLAKRRLLLAVTTLSIGLGVGTDVAVYSILRGVFGGWITGAAAADRLVTISPGISYPSYVDLQRRAPLLPTVALQTTTVTWRAATGTTSVGARVVSENFFDVLGVRPLYGKTFGAGNNPAENQDRVVVSFGFWRQRLGGSPAVIGQAMTLDGWPYTIAAVLPPDFSAPLGPLMAPSVYVPISPRISSGLSSRRAAQFDLIGRLPDGVTREQALARLQAAAQQLESEFPTENAGLARGFRLFDGTMSPVRIMLSAQPQGRLLLLLVAAVYGLAGLVLLMACANVAGLLAVRADQRRQELALRLALGASRARLVQQLLLESLVIAVFGCAAGAALWELCTIVMPMTPIVVNAGVEITPIPLPLLYCLALVFVVTVACGIAPAMTASGIEPIAGLKAGRIGHVFLHLKLQSVLVGTQVAVSFVLLTAAFLLLHAIVRLGAVDPGYDVAHTVSIEARLSGTARGANLTAVKVAIEALPGVEAASYGGLPLGLLPRSARVHVISEAAPVFLPVDLHPVGPRYLETMRIPLQRGRDLTDADLRRSGSSAIPVVVNETFAARFLGMEPIGAALALEQNVETGRPVQRLQVVGVARDVKTRSLADENLSVVYMPATGTSLVVRVAGSGAGAVRTLEQVVAERLPGAVAIARPMTDRLAAALLPVRLATLLLGVLGGLGLVLSTIGLHGLLSHAATRRTFEIGVRMALGATRSAAVWLVLRGAVVLIMVGSVVGALCSVVLVQALRPLLAAGQSPVDPIAIAAVVTVLLMVGALASALPARRAASVDPTVALRAE